MPSITLNIDDKEYADFEVAFLKENPLPLESFLTPLQWIEEWGRQQYLKAASRGKLKLVQESAVFDDGVISCSLAN